MLKLAAPSRRLLLLGWCAIAACGGDSAAREARSQGEARPTRSAAAPPVTGALFTMLPSSYTGVHFENRITETRDFNVFTYRNFYNGGGVAIGDLNGDGLPEVVLTSNTEGSRVYLNEGHFRFREVTDEAGVRGKNFWTTGIALADVNGDGLLDIYVCHSGNKAGIHRANELFINLGPGKTGVPTFRNRAAEFGVEDGGYSTAAAFFDYDGDGKLDLYVANNSPKPVSSFGLRNTRDVRDKLGGHRLYHNVGGRFEDVSQKAGIFGGEIAFGLGVVASDVNGDGRPDIYVANDFFERDYLYLNRGDGTFAESLDRAMPSSSYFSMGLDIADINNDGWPDIYTTDMLPEDENRLKSTSAFEGWDVYQAKVQNGYHHQLMRNMLQLNNGDGTFEDIGQLAGVARTDWSWSALIADLDLDGYKDVYVTNGIARDLTSQDYIAFLANDETMRMATQGNRVDFMRLIAAMSSTKLEKYAFRNRGNLTFANVTADWGLQTPAFSNGAAYGDLDGDGAVDLVVNNVNDEAFVYRNNARALRRDNRYLQVRLEGEGDNRFAVGAKVTLHAGHQEFFQELMPARGFQSSVDYVLTFGLGARDTVDSVTVRWPDGRESRRARIAANQRIIVRQKEAASGRPAPSRRPAPMFTDASAATNIDFAHHENEFVDFDREPLIPKLLSTDGPSIAVADVNRDGLDDLFIGGAKDQPGRLFVQRRDGGFQSTNEALFEKDKTSEDLGAVFFDANGDGAPDLYAVSGGSEFSTIATELQDRLYLNDGNGNLRKAADALPPETVSGSRVAAADFDGDGHIDLFVGGRVVPWKYGIDPESMLLRNDGKGHFRNVTAQVAPELARVGMVTDAVWRDVDGDGRPDLIVVGEWMPITIFRNTGAGTLERLKVPGLARSNGWWNRIVAGDFTGDGRVDFIVGNLGLNSRLHASESEPTTMYVKDFANSGDVAQIIANYNAGKNYPITMRDDLLRALPHLRKRYVTYKDYALQTVTDVFSPQDLSGAVVKTAYTFATALVRNDGNGGFTLVPFPAEAQFAPVYGILAGDFDGDGKTDLLLGGNFDGVKPEIGRLNASYGLLLLGDGRGAFTPVPGRQSGFSVPGQTRDIQRVRTLGGDVVVVARNNDRPMVFRPTRKSDRVVARRTR